MTRSYCIINVARLPCSLLSGSCVRVYLQGFAAWVVGVPDPSPNTSGFSSGVGYCTPL